MARAQKCGGVQTKMIRNSSSACGSTWLVTAVQPSTGGAAPAAPPITMFCEGAPHRIDDGIPDERCEREPCGQTVHEERKDHHARRAEHAGEHEGLSLL